MCLAIAVRKGFALSVSREDLAEGFSSNDDGAGFAYYTGGKVLSQKGFFQFDKFYDAFDKARMANPDSPFLIHFRIRTHGGTTPENTHPFKFKGGMMIHNGWFSNLGEDKKDGMSDTAHLAKLMHDLPVRAIPLFLKKLGQRTGSHNKIVILDNTGAIHFMNEKEGHWDDVKGVWFSNYSYIRQSWQGSMRFTDEELARYGVGES